MTTVKNIYDYMNSFAPFASQEAWDNSGFLIGEWKKEVKKCVVTLDVTKEIAALAEKQSVDLIVSHHPVIFSKLHSVHEDTVVYGLVRQGVSVISAHTNFDAAAGGVSDSLAEVLQLQNIVPIGENSLRVGELTKPITAYEFALYVKEKLNVKHLRYSEKTGLIKNVAVCGGAGADFIPDAMQYADAFVTGDASYHSLLDAGQAGFCLVAAGHFETENIGMKKLLKRLASVFPDVEFIDLKQQNPIHYI